MMLRWFGVVVTFAGLTSHAQVSDCRNISVHVEHGEVHVCVRRAVPSRAAYGVQHVAAANSTTSPLAVHLDAEPWER